MTENRKRMKKVLSGQIRADVRDDYMAGRP